MPKPRVSVSEVTFSGGQVLRLHPDEKVILVGPNNSGKSQTLREIFGVAREGSRFTTVTTKDVKLEKSGTYQELIEFLESYAVRQEDIYRHGSWKVHVNHVRGWNEPYLVNGLAEGFIKNIDANDRLRISEQQPSIPDGGQKSKPQHILYDNEALMNRVSGLFRQAFGKDLMINFRGGSVIPIHVGVMPPKELTNQVGDAYVACVKQNPLLDRQGDGMKSYAGILFEAIVADLDITLLDEPEAFLHPPQMRRLGATLASEVKGQMIVATHSSDILRGFLEGTKGNVRILRIRRENSENFIAEASPEVIRELWERPTLRYSNALEGIFHEQTIICEDDSDCRLFNAVADHLEVLDGSPWADTAYVPTGGKHGIPKVANVLRKVGVPVKAVFDIDLLSDPVLTREVVEAFGGNWSNFQVPWGRVDAAVRSGVKPKTNEEMKAEIKSIIDLSGAEVLPRTDIANTMKQGSAWSLVKAFGSDAIPAGDAQRDFGHLRESLEDIGIYLVQVGEAENFCRDIGAHGPKFVTKLLSEINLGDSRLSRLRDFVRHVHIGKHSPLP